MKVRRLYPRFKRQPIPLESMKNSMEELDSLLENHYKSNIAENSYSPLLNFWMRCMKLLTYKA